MKKAVYVFSLFAGFVTIAAVLGSRATQTGLETWYPALRKRSFQPPNVAFPIAWSALYTAIAIAGSLIYLSDKSRSRSLALAAWTAQMGLNAAWSELFFRYRRPDLALIDSAALLVSIWIFCAVARRVDRRAFKLFIPYFAWVAFATLLNEAILRLNPAAQVAFTEVAKEKRHEGSNLLCRA